MAEACGGRLGGPDSMTGGPRHGRINYPQLLDGSGGADALEELSILIHFEAEHGFMATLHHESRGIIFIKGAPEGILECVLPSGQQMAVDP